jgi:hypothetical protein
VAPAPPVAALPPTGPVVGRARDAAKETVKAFRLPMALTVTVLGFLVFQAWVDRRHPKLASAPIDEDDDELLPFS